jgi:21S rRNA (uridine2791-2'-O)-methyltransferase
LQPAFTLLRHKSSASSKRWNARQHRDKYTIEARVEGYKSRAAYKLIELHSKYRLFRPNQTVVDLGFAPGSWTQVAVQKTKPDGRVVGLDILPCRPPPGASAIQGNFLSAGVQEELKRMLIAGVGKRVKKHVFADEDVSQQPTDDVESYIDMERHQSELEDEQSTTTAETISNNNNVEFPVDLILSDMCAPWPQTHGFWLRTINDPYIRMANTTGNSFRDHGLSIVRKKKIPLSNLNPVFYC